MSKRRRPPAASGRFSMAVNGHALIGEKRGGKWYFECPSWPELAAAYRGDQDPDAVVGEFMRRCLAGAVTVLDLAAGG